MSGFFALRRETLDGAECLTPLGYKIALELMCKCRARRVREVPIHFGPRGSRALQAHPRAAVQIPGAPQPPVRLHLPALSPAVKFVVATAAAWLCGLGLFLSLSRARHGPHARRQFELSRRAARDRRLSPALRADAARLPSEQAPWRDFLVTCLCEWAVCAAAATWIANRVRDIHALEVFALTYAVATVTRYVLRKELMQDVRQLTRGAQAGGTSRERLVRRRSIPNARHRQQMVRGRIDCARGTGDSPVVIT